MKIKMTTIMIVAGLLASIFSSIAASDEDVQTRISELVNGDWTDAEQSAILADIIAETGETVDTKEGSRYIAQTIAQATWSLGERAPSVIGATSGQVDDEYLPGFSAAAVLSSGVNSPAVLESMMASQQENKTRMEMVESAAREPVAVLGMETAASIQPPSVSETRPTRLVQRETPELELAFETTSISSDEPVESSTDDTNAGFETTAGDPPRPPSIPPRPPAIPYRGQ